MKHGGPRVHGLGQRQLQALRSLVGVLNAVLQAADLPARYVHAIARQLVREAEAAEPGQLRHDAYPRGKARFRKRISLAPRAGHIETKAGHYLETAPRFEGKLG